MFGRQGKVNEKSGNFEMDILRGNPDQMREQKIMVINGGKMLVKLDRKLCYHMPEMRQYASFFL